MAKVQAVEKTLHPAAWGEPVERYNAVEIIHDTLGERRFALNEEVQVMTIGNGFMSGVITHISETSLDLKPRGGVPIALEFNEIEDITYWR